MKTERRHELDTNDLAVRLTHGIEAMKPHATKIVVGIVAVVALVVVAVVVQRQNTAQNEEAWTEFILASTGNTVSIEDLESLSKNEKFKNALGPFASLAAADQHYQKGINQLVINREVAGEHLEIAAKIYQEIKSDPNNTMIADRAAYCLALTLEAQGNIKEAIKQFEKAPGAWEEFGKARAKQLSKPSSQEFYTWFATAELPSPFASGIDGLPSSHLPFGVGGSGDNPHTGGLDPESPLFGDLFGNPTTPRGTNTDLPGTPEFGAPPEPPEDPATEPAEETPAPDTEPSPEGNTGEPSAEAPSEATATELVPEAAPEVAE